MSFGQIFLNLASAYCWFKIPQLMQINVQVFNVQVLEPRDQVKTGRPLLPGLAHPDCRLSERFSFHSIATRGGLLSASPARNPPWLNPVPLPQGQGMYLVGTRTSPKLLGSFFPDHRQVHDGLHGLFHILPADPFQPRMEGVFAGEDVGAGQPHERQPRAVGAAADRALHRC